MEGLFSSVIYEIPEPLLEVLTVYACISTVAFTGDTSVLWLCYVCRIMELQDDLIKVKLALENAQEIVKHSNTQVRNN